MVLILSVIFTYGAAPSQLPAANQPTVTATCLLYGKMSILAVTSVTVRRLEQTPDCSVLGSSRAPGAMRG